MSEEPKDYFIRNMAAMPISIGIAGHKKIIPLADLSEESLDAIRALFREELAFALQADYDRGFARLLKAIQNVQNEPEPEETFRVCTADGEVHEWNASQIAQHELDDEGSIIEVKPRE